MDDEEEELLRGGRRQKRARRVCLHWSRATAGRLSPFTLPAGDEFKH